MKNIFSKISNEIHPAYFELAAAASTTPAPAASKLDTLLKLAKLSVCFSAAAFFISLIPSRNEPQALSPSLSSKQSIQALEQRFQLIGEILDYLLLKVQGEALPTQIADVRGRTCRVNVAKALLRIGPGKNFSPLMAVSEGFELLVDGEKDDWLQVISPTGEAAWISKDVVES